MKLEIESKDSKLINLEETKKGWSYRLNDITVEGIKTKEEALQSASDNLIKMFKRFLK